MLEDVLQFIHALIIQFCKSPVSSPITWCLGIIWIIKSIYVLYKMKAKTDELAAEREAKEISEAVKNHPNTLFVACHFINCSYDLSIVGRLLDEYSNLYVDMSARFGETASIPRYMKKFYTRYADRILYGTDNGMSAEMYETTFRILETDDEHFYVPDYHYHWYYSGFDLPDEVLRKIYRENFIRIMK